MTDRGDYRKLVRTAEQHGVRVQYGRGRHGKLIWPDGTHEAIPGTPGSSKALVSFRRRLRAKGIPV